MFSFRDNDDEYNYSFIVFLIINKGNINGKKQLEKIDKAEFERVANDLITEIMEAKDEVMQPIHLVEEVELLTSSDPFNIGS